ncbi:1,3,4,6-tetrachloro-1,4-cyclohexadiene hydrolase [alpha proteobacterium U9-1i]|nr:1,3,4,6-tetrachloro-1,4-cyclohexadiene hydrolase [alpha proteobacterium U9-1i]
MVAALGASFATSCANSPSPQGAAEFRAAKKFVPTESGIRMAYFEAGRGAPIVFLHGNPTSSYLWRNVIPHLAGLGRCIAPDLIGMGDSDKLPDSGPGKYNFFEHSRRLDAFFDATGVRRDVTLVVHDWGGPLGFHWAMRNEARVRAIVFMETFVVSQNDANTPPFAMQFFSRFRTSEAELDVLSNNTFVEAVLLRQFPSMSEEDRAEYRRPFAQSGEGRRPTLEWPRQVPINGDPADVHEATLRFLGFMSETQIPKLFIRADPGALILGGRERVPRTWPRVTEAVVPGRHFVPEESPNEVGRIAAAWLSAIEG